MAIWLTTRRAQSGPVFGFEGESLNMNRKCTTGTGVPDEYCVYPTSDNFEGLGIFIDTYDSICYDMPNSTSLSFNTQVRERAPFLCIPQDSSHDRRWPNKL